MGDVSTSRLRDELIALLEEKGRRLDPPARRAASRPAIRAPAGRRGGRGSPRRLVEAPRAVRRGRSRVAPGPDRARARAGARRPTAGSAAEGPPSRRQSDRERRRRRPACRRAAPRRGDDPAEVVALCDPYAPDAPLYALALSDLPPLAYFERLREVRLEITGADVVALGLSKSPRVGECWPSCAGGS